MSRETDGAPDARKPWYLCDPRKNEGCRKNSCYYRTRTQRSCYAVSDPALALTRTDGTPVKIGAERVHNPYGCLGAAVADPEERKRLRHEIFRCLEDGGVIASSEALIDLEQLVKGDSHEKKGR